MSFAKARRAKQQSTFPGNASTHALEAPRRSLQTVQFEGIAVEPQGRELKRYQEMYFAVWPDGPLRMTWPGLTYFVVRPRWIRYSDFDQRPPLIEEMTLGESLATAG